MNKPDKTDSDVLIIGGGPAGMSAAVWCSDLGLSSVLIDRDAAYGGQLSGIHNPIQNYIGRLVQNGSEMLEHFTAHLEKSKFERRTGVPVTLIDVDDRAVELEDGTKLTADAIIVATGVRRRELGVPGERTFIGPEGHAGAGRVVRLFSVPTASVAAYTEPLSSASAEELKKALEEKRIAGVAELLAHDFSTVVRKDDADGPGSLTYRIEQNGPEIIAAVKRDNAAVGHQNDANDLSRSSSRSLIAALIGGALLALTAIFGGLWLIRRASRNQ